MADASTVLNNAESNPKIDNEQHSPMAPNSAPDSVAQVTVRRNNSRKTINNDKESDIHIKNAGT